MIDKFETALLKGDLRNESPNIFVLVDEGHRGQYGLMHGRMRKALPNACFIAFTGTPVQRKEKDTDQEVRRPDSADLHDPAGRGGQGGRAAAVRGADVEQRVDTREPWTVVREYHRRSDEGAEGRPEEEVHHDRPAQQGPSRRSCGSRWDISEHFRDNWQGTPYKAQLVAQDKATALLYKRFLDEFGMVSVARC